jgi:1-acyl-sn-glycerol-3-phosphate acyltransferase
MLLWCRRCIINKPELLEEKGPLLLACNHPNSFLDGILLDTLFRQPVHALARGDAFRNKHYRRVLDALKLLPVYRTSEGVENLSENYKTFDACKAIFRKEGIVQIFSEGKCINEWHLRPLKKGTARLAISSWEDDIPLRVLPVGINYSSFKRFGKNIFINFGSIIQQGDIEGITDGNQHQSFNLLLENQFRELVFEIDPEDRLSQEKKLAQRPSLIKKILLTVPGAAGWLLHIPFYLPLRAMTNSSTKETDHYDSVLTSLLMLLYPVYLLLITGIVFLFTRNNLAFLLLILLPFTAWSYMQVKPQLDKRVVSG